MFCIGCGADILPDAAFCNKCGAKQTPDDPKIKASGQFNPMAISDGLIDKLIHFFRNTLTADFFNKNNTALEKWATWATPAAALIGLLIAIVGAIKVDSFQLVLLGIGWVISVAISYYIGSRFLSSCKRTIQNNPTKISSLEYLNAVGLILIIVLFGLVIGGIYTAVKFSSMGVLLWIVPLAVALVYYICIFLNPHLITTEIVENASAGEDALAIFVVSWKAALKLSGIVFGSMTVIGAVTLLFALFDIFKLEGRYLMHAGIELLSGSYLVISGLLYPFFIYLTFILIYLFVDLCRAILSVRKY